MPWEEAEDWQKESVFAGVEEHIKNPLLNGQQSHETWTKYKEETGWKYGPVKDAEKKEHPCMVPYNDLPYEQKIKDIVFSALVNELKNFDL